MATTGFEAALPGYVYRFPEDGGAHPSYKDEWWYYTGHLSGPSGRFGVELTFFRVGVQPHPARRSSRWAASSIYLAHFALADLSTGEFAFDERIDRGALGVAGADRRAEHAWIGDWSAAVVPEPGKDPRLWPHRLRAASAAGSIDLDLTPLKGPVIHGSRGISVKAAGPTQASHYYSYTRLRASGFLTKSGRREGVTGQLWMDHEFGSSELSSDERGWDWFGLQFDDGRELMLYQIRGKGDRPTSFSSGSLVAPDGDVTHLTSTDFRVNVAAHWRSPASGVNYPSGWTIRIPGRRMVLTVEPEAKNQELRSRQAGVVYWEGAVKVSSGPGGVSPEGSGYAELTGYGGPMTQLR